MMRLPGLRFVTSPPVGPRGFVTQWTPFDLRAYLEGREGKIWQREDTLRLQERAEQVDALLEQLLRAAGIEMVEE
jgi:hypothetical protein